MKKVLIVEDDPMLVEIYQKKLSSVGYEIETVSDGNAAKKRILEGPKDIGLVLLDLIIPASDGFTVLEAIKSNPETQDIKVVVFSNLSQEEDMEKAQAMGAEKFIIKSNYTPQELLEQIEEFLEKPEGGTFAKNEDSKVKNGFEKKSLG